MDWTRKVNPVTGLTVTVGPGNNGFGVFSNGISPAPVTAPALFVAGDGSGSTLLFSAPVTVPSLWTSAATSALNNDVPGKQQRILGKLNGVLVWGFTNTVATANDRTFFQVTTGVGKVINELVVYPKWIGIDNLQIQ